MARDDTVVPSARNLVEADALELVETEGADDVDCVLVEAAKRGDGEAYAQLVDKYHARVYGIIYRMCGAAEAEDITQDVFVRALRALRSFQFQGQASFRTWLYRIAVNAAINELRKRGRRSQVVGASLEELQEADNGIAERLAPDTSQSPEIVLERKEVQRAVHAALSKLTPKHRAVITLVDLEGLPYEEAARILGCPSGTVKSRLARARAAFAKVFQRYQQGKMRIQI